MEKETKNIVEEAMNKLVKEILKNGDEKTVFDVEGKCYVNNKKLQKHYRNIIFL